MAENTNNNGATASGKRPSEAFCELVVKKYSDVAHGLIVTEKEKAIIAGYFISIDNAIKKMGIDWKDIDNNSLALDLAHKARLGLDMQMPNYLFPVPYRNKNGVVTLTLINGYKGDIHLAMKFAEEIPLNIRAELVYDTDEFIPIKKGVVLKNPKNRVGFLGYLKNPKNPIMIMSMIMIMIMN